MFAKLPSKTNFKILYIVIGDNEEQGNLHSAQTEFRVKAYKKSPIKEGERTLSLRHRNEAISLLKFSLLKAE